MNQVKPFLSKELLVIATKKQTEVFGNNEGIVTIYLLNLKSNTVCGIPFKVYQQYGTI